MPQAKCKHNKKRNTGILKAVLIQEMTKAILEKNEDQQKTVKRILLEFFSAGTEIGKESRIFKDFSSIESMSSDQVRSLIYYAKEEHGKLNSERLNKEKDHLISEINYKLGQDTFDYFVPNYKLLATIDQILAGKLSSKEKMMLETRFIEEIEFAKEDFVKLPSIDSLTYKTYVKKFNEKYSNLLEEQKRLLFEYIISLEKNNVGFKFYLNEEISRMKKLLEENKDKKSDINDNKEQILRVLDDFKKKESIGEEMLSNMLKIQELVDSLCRSR